MVSELVELRRYFIVLWLRHASYQAVDVGERIAPLGAVMLMLITIFLLTDYALRFSIRLCLLGRHHDNLRVQNQRKRQAIPSNR